ncbi:hypothetical protein B9Z55_026229 [Caenorhabditis nigoni]|nr:hypothetical protein B9Z55_026229 [Caenorhabditis nigoni]
MQHHANCKTDRTKMSTNESDRVGDTLDRVDESNSYTKYQAHFVFRVLIQRAIIETCRRLFFQQATNICEQGQSK